VSQQTELLVKINVQDGASPEFRKIGQSAQAMGQQINRTGQSSASTMQRLQTVARQAGLGVGLLGGAFTMFARSARDAERELMTLERTYGETADSLRQFGDELQRTTAFSSEQAIEAANTFGTLSRNYGLTAEQIQNLITVSADLAAVNGISLADAAERVQAAIRGEAESAEALGLTMNETAIGLAGMSAGMTEAEKAAYRYNALLGQAGFATGAAAEQADTAAGRMEQLTNTLQDAGRSVVDFTGPLGGAVAGLSNASMELGLAAAGFASLGGVAKSAGDALGITTKAVGLMSRATGLLSTAMGPVGLALAAGAAVVGLVALARSTSDYSKEAREAEEQTQTLMERLDALAMSSVAGSQLESDAETVSVALEAIGGNLENTSNAALEATLALRDLQIVLGLQGDTVADVDSVLAGLTDTQREVITSTAAWSTAIEDGSISGTELDAVLTELEGSYSVLGDQAGNAATVIEMATGIIDRADDTGVNTAETMRLLALAFEEFAKTGDYNALIEDLTAIDSSLDNIGTTAAKTSQAVIDLGKVMYDAWWSVMDPMAGVNDMLIDIFSSTSPYALEAQRAINGTTGALEEYNRTVGVAGGNGAIIQGATEQFYATASALEILNFELERAGDNVEAQNQAWRNFALRVNETGTALETVTTGVEMQNAAFAEQNRIMGLNADTATRMAFERGVIEAETQRRIANEVAKTDGIIADQQAQMQRSGEGAASLAEYTAEQIRLGEAVANTDDAIARQQAQFETSGEAAAEYSREVGAAEQASAELSAEAYAAATSVGALDTALEQLVAIGAGTGTEGIGRGFRVHIIDVANEALNSVNALNDGFRVLVENPIAWGRQAQEVADWATGMIMGAEGVNSLSDLWGRGQIETITYNRGLEAQGRIMDANVDIQNDVARIQAKQLPIMADLIESQAKYIDGLADLDPMNQMVALGYMDATKAQQAQNLVMLAGAAAAGQYGALGTQMATDIITAAAQADPVLKAMLIDLGLITETEGEIDIKFTRAKSLNDDLQDLVASINALVIALGGVPPVTDADVNVNVRYNVNGRPALPGDIGFTQFATGGTVTHRAASATPMYATAATGRTTLVGEAGPELVSLPVGSQVTSAPATADRMSRRTAGSGGGVYFYGPVTLQPSSTDVEMAIRREALSGSRGY
jgi:hypothetical protein